MPLKEGCRSLPLADRARYSTSVRSDGFTQTARLSRKIKAA
jgi:hypothetical protein